MFSTRPFYWHRIDNPNACQVCEFAKNTAQSCRLPVETPALTSINPSIQSYLIILSVPMWSQLSKWPSAPCTLYSCQFPNLVDKIKLRPVSRTPVLANIKQDHEPVPPHKKKHHRCLATLRRHCLFYITLHQSPLELT